MNKKSALALLALAFGLVACESSTESSGGFSCDVTRTSSTVKVEERISGVASYTSTVTAKIDEYGDDYVNIDTELWYANNSIAREDCESWRDEARSWRDGSMSVKCSGNYIYIYEYDEGSLNSHERNFEEMCEDGRRRYENGEFDQYM